MPKFFRRNAGERGAMPAQQRQSLVAGARIDGNDFGFWQRPVRRSKPLLVNRVQRLSQRLAAVEGEKDD